MYEKELLLCPIVREPLAPADMDDLADALTKVLENADEIASSVADDGALFTPVDAAIKTDVR